MMEKETVWRLQDDDFIAVMNDMNVPQERQSKLLEYARQHFSIDNWTELVESFIEVADTFVK